MNSKKPIFQIKCNKKCVYFANALKIFSGAVHFIRSKWGDMSVFCCKSSHTRMTVVFSVVAVLPAVRHSFLSSARFDHSILSHNTFIDAIHVNQSQATNISNECKKKETESKREVLTWWLEIHGLSKTLCPEIARMLWCEIRKSSDKIVRISSHEKIKTPAKWKRPTKPFSHSIALNSYQSWVKTNRNLLCDAIESNLIKVHPQQKMKSNIRILSADEWSFSDAP